MEYGKRNGIFTRTRRNFLRFRYEKHTVPQRKTYGSHGGNIRFAEENIKTMETLHGFLHEVCKKYFLIETKQQTEKWDKDFFLLLKLHLCNEFYKTVS